MMISHSSTRALILQWYLNLIILSSFVTDSQLNGTTLNVTAPETQNSQAITPQNSTANISTTTPQDNVTENHFVSERDYSEEVIFGRPLHANGSEPLEYIPWDELHIVKITTKTPTGTRKSAGALVQDRIVVTCCRCIMLTDSNYPVSSLGIERNIEVMRGVTGETRYVDRMSFGIRSYCIDDPDTNVAVTLILTRPFHVDPIRLALGPTRKHCRFYAFSKKRYAKGDRSILGHHDLKVLIFRPSSRICQNRTVLTNRRVICGAIFDNDRQLCELRPGAVVICDLRLMGVSQTSCKVPYYHTSDNRTKVLAYVSILAKQELRYWHKLIALIGEDSDSYCFSNKANYPLLISSFIIAVDMVYFYT